MNWKQKENVLREQRTILATKNNYMGPAGVLGSIARYLGDPIIRQGGSLYDEAFLDDPYADHTHEQYEDTASGQRGPLVYRDEILSADETFVQHEGYLFSGLGRGMQLEIQLWKETNKIQVFYKGYLVYKEVAGELEAYAPFADWEDLVGRLYKVAKKKMQVARQEEEAEVGKVLQKEKQNFLHRLRMRWGI